MLSFGQDIFWRNKICKIPDKKEDQVLLDLATGTGDILFSFLKKRKDIAYAIGLDMSINMLKEAEKKSLHKKFNKKAGFLRGDANQIPLSKEKADF